MRSRNLKKGVRGIRDTASSVSDSARNAVKKASDMTIAAAKRVETASKKAADATTSVADGLLATTQGLLASRLSDDINGLLQNMVKGSATIYDRAMDANKEIGGGNYHRLFDGGHTIIGAFRAARDASPDDNIIKEAIGTIQGLLRDGTTIRGLPLVTLDKETFDQFSGSLDRFTKSLKPDFGIPRPWVNDLLSYDAAELLGSAIGVVSLAFRWNRADTEAFSRLVGSMGISAASSANPLLLVVTVVALAKAFHKAHQKGEYAEFIDGQLKGGLTTGASLGAVALVGAAGGPAGVPLLTGFVVGVLANRATKNVSVVQISQFMAEQATVAAAKAKEIAVTQISGNLPGGDQSPSSQS